MISIISEESRGTFFEEKRNTVYRRDSCPCAGSLGWNILFYKGQYGSITITVDGEEYGTYSLGKDQTISINDTNVCEIKDGKAHMISATCPDHLCMKQREIDEKGGTIVCLPNKVVIEGSKSADSTDSSDELSIDAVT